MSDASNPVECERCLAVETVSAPTDLALPGRYWRCVALSVKLAEVSGIWPGLNPADTFGCALKSGYAAVVGLYTLRGREATAVSMACVADRPTSERISFLEIASALDNATTSIIARVPFCHLLWPVLQSVVRGTSH